MADTKSTRTRYPSELKERALKMVFDLRAEDPSDLGVISRVARQLNIGQDSLRQWVKKSEVDSGLREGLSTDQVGELKALRKENRELKRANAILQSASAFFGAELDRRSNK